MLSPGNPVNPVDYKAKSKRQHQNKPQRAPVDLNSVSGLGLGRFEQSHVAKCSELEAVAAVLSPGMARVLERLVAGYVSGVRPQFSIPEFMLLQCAGAALSVVNRTPGSAEEIGRGAAVAVCKSPDSLKLVQAARTLNQRRIG